MLDLTYPISAIWYSVLALFGCIYIYIYAVTWPEFWKNITWISSAIAFDYSLKENCLVLMFFQNLVILVLGSQGWLIFKLAALPNTTLHKSPSNWVRSLMSTENYIEQAENQRNFQKIVLRLVSMTM